MYGDPHAYEAIVAANPDVIIRPILEGGIKLRVPVREMPTPTVTDLPPWKQCPPPPSAHRPGS